MTRKTPDYHQILGIQPDASPQEVKGAHRRLMVEMKMHPDLGGDHAKAAEINEAYAVLSDRARAAEYNRAAVLSRLQTARASVLSAERRSTGATDTRRSASGPLAPKPASNPPKKASIRRCPLCRAELPPSIAPEERCDRCHSPLSKPPVAGGPSNEVYGRRSSRRAQKSNLGTVFTTDYPQGLTVKMRDLSLNGISFFAEAPFYVDQTFRFHDLTVEAVASVVSCYKQGERYCIHSRLLSVTFQNKAGVFISATG